MTRTALKAATERLTGKPLCCLCFACEAMLFDFGDISVHSQCFTRVIHENRILFTTWDYQNWDGVTDTENDEWVQGKRYRDEMLNRKVVRTELTGTNDLFVWLEGGYLLQLFVSNGAEPLYGVPGEQWRLIEGEHRPHLVVTQTSVEFQ
mgnify:CR=1 FL=1